MGREPHVQETSISGESGTSEHEKRLRNAVETVASRWLEQMEVMHRMESELGAQLVQCQTSREAIGVSTEWLAKRVDSLVAVQHHLIELWLECDAGRSLVAAECRGAELKKRGQEAALEVRGRARDEGEK